MKPRETVELVRIVQALCPAQAIDEYTPDAWHLILDDLRPEDCRQAVANLGARQHFVDPSDIRAEVRRIRADRIRRHGDPIPPGGLDTQADIAWRRDALRRIGDGETVDGRATDQLAARPGIRAIGATS